MESIYTNFRPKVDGKELSNNDLKEILFTSDDGKEREKVWTASKEVGALVEKLVLELVTLRNQAAKQVGFPDYYTMGLELQELNQEALFTLLSELKRKTDPLWERYMRQLAKERKERFHTDTLYPWHLDDLFFQEAPKSRIDYDALYDGKDIVEISKRFYSHIGMPVEDIVDRSDLFEREHKCQHAFCFNMDRQQDVRILCNIRPDEYWMCTQLHELGHAVYDKYIDQTLPYLLRTTAHTSTTEAIAMIFGRLSKDPKFIDRYIVKGGTKDSNIHENLLIFSRWMLVMTHFERDLYQSPTMKRNAQWWNYVKEFQWITPPINRDKPDWAAKLHLACAPVYYQNYLLGEMTASQLKASIGDLLAPDAGRYLREKLFALGASYPWDETIEQVTGEPLNSDYFVRDLHP